MSGLGRFEVSRRTRYRAILLSAALLSATASYAQQVDPKPSPDHPEGPASSQNKTGQAHRADAAAGGRTQSTQPELAAIVVTASRRGEQNVFNVPLAVDAYSGASLAQYKIGSLQDLTRVDPSLTVVNLGATQQQVVIRGISSSVGATTGVYLDEAPLVGPFNGNSAGDGTPSLRLHDIDHIEVLKGPQGTLFGAGSMDGTLRAVTNKPRLDEVAGSVDLSGSTISSGDGLFEGTATFNLPIVADELGIRAVVWAEQGGGFIDKRFLNGGTDKHSNGENLYGGRVSVRWRPVENLTIDLAGNYQPTTVAGPQYVTPSVGDLKRPADATQYTNYAPGREDYDENYQLYSVVADYDVGKGHIIASGSYGQKNLLDTIDGSGTACFFGFCPGTPYYPSTFSSDLRYRDVTGELRFSSRFDGPVQIVAGIYGQNDRRAFSGAALVASADTGEAPCDTYVQCAARGLNKPGVGNSPVIFANGDQFDTRQRAVYAQADYKILSNLTATVGARYFKANLTDVATNEENVYPDFIFGIVTVPSVGPANRDTQSKPTYNFSLLWKPQEMLSLYARAASGFRIGGINNDASVAAQGGVTIPGSFGSDNLWDYEVGAKFETPDRRLYLDVSTYHIDWSNQQVNALAAGVFNYQLNAGRTRTNGVEVNALVRPVRGLLLAGGLTYVDARLESELPPDVVNGGTPGQKGDPVPYVPHLIYSGRAEYEAPLWSRMTGYAQTDFNYRGSSFTQFRPVSAAQIAAGVPDNFDTEVPSYFVINARAGVRFGNMDLSLFVRNLTNKFTVAGVKADASSVRYYVGRPRTIGISVAATF